MKYIGPEIARLIALYSPEELRPLAGKSRLDFLELIQQRYQFQIAPNLVELRGDTSVLKFQFGGFEDDVWSVAIREMTFLSTALSIDTRQSDEARVVFEDFYNWASEVFKWRKPITPIRFRHFSAVVVEFEHATSEMMRGLERACALFSEAIREQYGFDAPYDLKSINLAGDHQKLPASVVGTEVSIQRRADFPFEANRWYCTGPFPTETLVGLLERAEAAMSKG